MLWIGAFWLPAAVVLFELISGMCAEAFFDPMPTLLHVALVASVPLLNGYTLWQLEQTDRHTSLPWLNGLAFGISGVYALAFLPMLPLALFALLFGIGLLPLTPLITFVATWRIRSRLRPVFPSSGRRFMTTALVAVALLVVVDLPRALTRVAMSVAASENPERRTRAVSMLRRLGNTQELLRQSYGAREARMDLLGFGLALVFEPPSTEESREIYYRVTGRAFNSVKPPVSRRQSFDFWDEDQGGEQVGAVQRGLFLAQSTLDGSLDGDASLGYLEWQMEFSNEGSRQQEARAQVQLPRGGVVSRATLWVNGVEEEAVIASRGAARRAYSDVVRQSRDPLLVTTVGPDRVLIQCFPVLPAQRMKVRIGISFPMTIEARANAVARLPFFVERNFGIKPELNHHLWIESKDPLRGAPELKAETTGSRYALRGSIPDDRLRASGSSRGGDLILERNGGDVSWAEDSSAPADKNDKTKKSAFVVQTLEEREGFRPRRLVIVLDTSSSLSGAGTQLAASLSTLPAGLEVFVVPATEVEPEALTSEAALKGGDRLRELASRTAALGFAGGVDNTPALIKAWDLAADGPAGAILWIHGPQPVILGPGASLNQRFERRPDGPQLWFYSAAPGPNRIVESLSARASTRWIAGEAGLERDLRDLFESLASAPKEWVAHRQRVAELPATVRATGEKTSAHLTRLWAHDVIREGVRQGFPREGVVQTAVRYRLVTEVSGAVVLETKRDYEAAGLTPSPAQDIPTVPEPEVWALILIALTTLAFHLRQSQRERRQIRD